MHSIQLISSTLLKMYSKHVKMQLQNLMGNHILSVLSTAMAKTNCTRLDSQALCTQQPVLTMRNAMELSLKSLLVQAEKHHDESTVNIWPLGQLRQRGYNMSALYTRMQQQACKQLYNNILQMLLLNK